MTTNFQQNYYLFSIILGIGQVKIISGPSAPARTGQRPSTAAMTGQGVGRCSHMTNYIHVLHIRSYKIYRRGRGRGPKIVLQVNTKYCSQSIQHGPPPLYWGMSHDHCPPYQQKHSFNYQLQISQLNKCLLTILMMILLVRYYFIYI